jgi:AraC-like DNA-binding protein
MDFLSTFQPKILDVLERGQPSYWTKCDYNLLREGTHTEHNIVFVFEGIGELGLNGDIYPIRRGAFIYIPRGSELRITTSRENTLKFYSVYLTYGQLAWDGEKAVWKEAEKPHLPLEPYTSLDDQPKVFESFYRLYNIWEGKRPGYDLYSRMEMIHLFDLVRQALHEASPHAQQTAKIIEATLGYIRDHLHEDLNRTSLSARFFLTSAYFASTFKKHVGISLSEFISNLRMEEARRLLSDTNLPIRDVAAKIGFNDSFYFTRIFKKQHGLSPRQYRKMKVSPGI